MDNNLIVFVGDSGSGKSHYEKEMIKHGYEKITSHTTRNARIGEINCIDYFFVSREEFEQIEFIEQVEIHGNKYGVSKDEIERKKNDIVLVAEPNGVEQILKQMNAIIILLDLPKEVRKQNMINRGDTIENINKRLDNEDFKTDLKNKGIKPDIIIDYMVENIEDIIYKINEVIEFKKNNKDISIN